MHLPICLLTYQVFYSFHFSVIHLLIHSTSTLECLVNLLCLVLELSKCVCVCLFMRGVLVEILRQNYIIPIMKDFTSSIIYNHNGLHTLVLPKYSVRSTFSVLEQSLEHYWYILELVQFIGKEQLSKKNVLSYSVNMKGSYEDMEGSHYLEGLSEWGTQFLEEVTTTQ